MEWILQAVKDAILLLIQRDPEILEISYLTLRVAGTSTLISVFIGVPIGYLLAFHNFFGRKLLVSIANLGLGFPTVAVGLFVWLMLARNGPMGGLEWLYTPTAMVIAQSIIASPVVMSFSVAAFQQLNPKIHTQILALGASRLQLLLLLVREARLGLLAAVMAGFGVAISEVGAAQMVGGNIRGETRVLTTSIVQSVNMGNQELGLALCVILLALAYLVVLVLTMTQQQGRMIK
ncbi:ABC transporter permease [Desulfofalx alkaliphila]|uniref:ABC transporter permease n=1 Tax=Desulfofalx alkaliphila TaxID=105483 RepID=UPI0004E1A26B|nr:ABC transporter permease [Desulfofalx alkaliphila]